MPEQRLAQGNLFSIRPANDFLAAQAEGPNEFFDQVRTIRGHDPERISDLVSQVRAVESDLKMPGLSAQSRTIKVEVGQEAGGERLLLASFRFSLRFDRCGRLRLLLRLSCHWL